MGGGRTHHSPPLAKELLEVNGSYEREVSFFSDVATDKLPMIHNPATHHAYASNPN